MVDFSVPPFPSFFVYVWCAVVMGAEEPNLMPKTMASSFTEEDVYRLGKKFEFVADAQLEALEGDECITERMVTRVALHEESLNAGLRSPCSQ